MFGNRCHNAHPAGGKRARSTERRHPSSSRSYHSPSLSPRKVTKLGRRQYEPASSPNKKQWSKKCIEKIKPKTILRSPHQTQNKAEKETGKKRVTFKTINKKCRTKNHGRKSSHKINIMYENIYGAIGKENSLLTAVQTNSSHIITLTETKITSHLPKINGYSWLTKNRNYNQGGGVAILIRDDIKHTCQKVTDLEDRKQDICWIKNAHKQLSSTYRGLLWQNRNRPQKNK